MTYPYDIPLACQAGLTAAEELGFAPRDRYAVGTSVSELATNLLVHAGDGIIEIYQVACGNTVMGIELVASDTGPGIPDVDLALRDGFTTAGGLGGGLPAVSRLMNEIVVMSAVGEGTVVRATKWRDGMRPPRFNSSIGELGPGQQSVTSDTDPAWRCPVTRRAS